MKLELGPPCFGLFVVFLILQLANVIDWSWWWVTAPLWGPLAVFLVVFAIFEVVCLAAGFVVGLWRGMNG